METWALDYARKTGLRARKFDGEVVKVAAVAVGNMHAPDPDDFQARVLDRLVEGDVVLSPSGPNYPYLSAAYRCGARVFWIHPARLGATSGDVSQTLLDRFTAEPAVFYEYQPSDAGVMALRSLVFTWLAVQRDRVAATNALAQRIRREQDFARFHGAPDREAWVAREVEAELRRIVRQLGAIRLPIGETDEATGRSKTEQVAGAKLDDAQREALRAKLRTKYEHLYDRYFDPEGKIAPKDRERARRELVALRLELTGLLDDEAQTERDVTEALEALPENKLFDGLVSEGAVRTRAQLLAFLRNPRLYPVLAALAAYAGLGLSEGQARRARAGDADAGVREFRRALVFDFGAFVWKNDTVGFFRALYLAYKRFQYLRYWELIQLTAEVFTALGKRSDDEDEEKDEVGGEAAAGESAAATDDGSGDGMLGQDAVEDCIRQLVALRDLGRDKGPDLIWRSSKMLHAIEEIECETDPGRRKQLLWWIFSRSGEVPVGKEWRRGLNLQLTPKRVENQIYRMLGRTLLAAIYYRWLAQVGQSLPLGEDFLYCREWRGVTGAAADAVPTEYDHEVTRQYFEMEAERLKAEREAAGTALPAEVVIKLWPKTEAASTDG